MSSSHLLPNPVHDIYYPLNSRASSATLFLSHRIPYSQAGLATDPVDMKIAQGLLQTDKSRKPRLRSSFSHSTIAQEMRFAVRNGEQLVDSGLCSALYSRPGVSSNAWTSSEGEGPEEDENDDRTPFMDEYNRLAKKYGIQPIVPDEFMAAHIDKIIISAKPVSWIMRKLLRRASSAQESEYRTEMHLHHKRSISDISLRMMQKKDHLKGKDLSELVRLCGASPLYLPAEYAVGTLAVPTCFRATAQYLVQHAAASRGIFRIPGAHSAINALYNHYASQYHDGEVINGTVRCPKLPEHIQCNVHDVASAFKKFLAGLPGGILGKTWLLDAFMSIYNQLDAEADWMRTKQSKVRARLIALAIATVVPRYQRELICAVLGLLSMIGRAAETAPREDEHGRPLPTSDLMGYGALGIVFGPLLVGNLLECHTLCPKGPRGSLIFVHVSPPKASKGRHKKAKSTDGPVALLQGTDKIRVVNGITEMLIRHWRDVVRQMKDLKALKSVAKHHGLARELTRGFAPTMPPELFVLRRPQDWGLEKTSARHVDRSRSPTPSSRNIRPPKSLDPAGCTTTPQDDVLSVRKRRSRPRPMSNKTLSGAKSVGALTQKIGEAPLDKRREQLVTDSDTQAVQSALYLNDGDFAKASKCIPKFPFARPGQLDESNSEQAIAKKIESQPPLINQRLEYIESNTEDSKATPRAHQMTSRGLCYPAENAEVNVVGVHTPISKLISASSLSDRHKQGEELSEEPKVVSPPSGGSKYIPNQWGAFSQIPTGIVSSRLQGITASDPRLEDPLGFIELPRTDHEGIFPQRHRPNTAIDSLHAPKRFLKDPLCRVSHEEDMASLASLAGVIQSEDENVYIDTGLERNVIKRNNTPVKPCMKSTDSVTSKSESHNRESLSKAVNQNNAQESQTPAAKKVSPVDTRTVPMTPRRSKAQSSMFHRGGRSSVKSLAARFGDAKMDAKQMVSPVHAPDSRVWHGSLVEKAVVTPRPVISSPIPTAQKLTRSATSLQLICNPVQNEISPVVPSSKLQSITFPLLLKPSLSASRIQEDSEPQKWPTLCPVNRNPQRDSDFVQVGHGFIALPPFSSILRRARDGNARISPPPKSSLGKTLPRPEKLPVAGYMDFARPAATCIDHNSSSHNFSTSSPFLINSSPSSSVECQKTKKQNTSILYTQIQHLSSQLRTRADEADQLRRQLAARDSLNDLGTLSQQLREAKRDLTLWRGRAEIAEKRLEMLFQLSQKEDEAIMDEQSAMNASKTRGKNVFKEGERFETWIRNEQHEFDRCCADQNLAGSREGIRHASRQNGYLSGIEMNNV